MKPRRHREMSGIGVMQTIGLIKVHGRWAHEMYPDIPRQAPSPEQALIALNKFVDANTTVALSAPLNLDQYTVMPNLTVMYHAQPIGQMAHVGGELAYVRAPLSSHTGWEHRHNIALSAAPQLVRSWWITDLAYCAEITSDNAEFIVDYLLVELHNMNSNYLYLAATSSTLLHLMPDTNKLSELRRQWLQILLDPPDALKKKLQLAATVNNGLKKLRDLLLVDVTDSLDL